MEQAGKEKVESKIITILSHSEYGISRKIEQLKKVLKGITEINPDIVKLINIKLKGAYGSEYIFIQSNYQSFIEFYSYLNQTFPSSAEVLLSLGDIFLLTKEYSRSLDTFNEAFYKKPLLIFEAPGELTHYLKEYGSESQNIYYRLSLVRALLLDDELDEAIDEYHDIINTYKEKQEVIEEYLQEPSVREELSQLLR